MIASLATAIGRIWHKSSGHKGMTLLGAMVLCWMGAIPPEVWLAAVGLVLGAGTWQRRIANGHHKPTSATQSDTTPGSDQ